MARGKLGTVSNILAYCDLFPTRVAATDFHEPVESDIPALILLGAADTQTATSWGLHAAKSLENGEAVSFPETGHGAFRFSQCAKDIGAAFLSDPDDELNVGCTDDLRPAFVLPPTN